jgi:hypothetical protein
VLRSFIGQVLGFWVLSITNGANESASTVRETIIQIHSKRYKGVALLLIQWSSRAIELPYDVEGDSQEVNNAAKRRDDQANDELNEVHQSSESEKDKQCDEKSMKLSAYLSKCCCHIKQCDEKSKEYALVQNIINSSYMKAPWISRFLGPAKLTFFIHPVELMFFLRHTNEFSFHSVKWYIFSILFILFKFYVMKFYVYS